MTNLATLLLAPLALLLPANSPVDPGVRAEMAGLTSERFSDGPVSRPQPGLVLGILPITGEPEAQNQVRIQQRVVIRISPRRDSPRAQLAAITPQAERTRLVEREIGNCLALDLIGGVQPAANNSLVLFLRDRRILTLALERACNARDFYSGLYVERHKDGMFCAGRDHLQSRTGANCEVSQVNQLVLERD